MLVTVDFLRKLKFFFEFTGKSRNLGIKGGLEKLKGVEN